MPKFLDVTSKSTARTYLDVPSLVQQRTRGRMVLILDGPYVSAGTAMDEAEKRGQRLNLAIVPNEIGGSLYLSTLAISKAAKAGHGMMVMGFTHAKATDLSDSALVTEYDTGLKWVASTTGKAVTEIDHCYSQSSHDDRTDSIFYLRGRRAFAGKWGGANWYWRYPFYKNHPYSHGRFGWDSSNHTTVLADIQSAATANEDIVLYAHATDGSNINTDSITLTELREALDLAKRLGMPVVSVDELGDPPQKYLDDPGFEDANNFSSNFEVIVTGLSAGQYEAGIVDVTPASGVVGSKALRIAVNSGASTTNTVTVRQRRWVPAIDWAMPPYTAEVTTKNDGVLGARVKCNKSSGTGGASLVLRTADYLNDVKTGSGGTAISSPTWTTNSWSGPKEFLTTGYNSTYGRDIGLLNYQQWLIPEYRITNMIGEAWFDHAMLSVGIHDNFA